MRPLPLLGALTLLVSPLRVDASPCFACPQPGGGTLRIGWWDDRPLSPAGRTALAPRVDAGEWSGTSRVAIVWEERAADGDVVLALSDDGGCTWTTRAVTSGP